MTEVDTESLGSRRLPMEGIRVLDFSWGGAGPFATKALADHGAEVIKVETSTHYDFPRTMAPFAGKERGINRSAYFTNRNSSKLGVTLNLKTTGGVDLAKRLIPSCDLIVNNFRAGVLERAGLGYQEAAELRPDVIYVSMPLQGTGGPQANYSGVGHTLNVIAGIYDTTSYEDGTIVGPGTNFPDHSVNPGHALVAILAALTYRRRTGRGQYIEISQLESTLNLLGPHILAASMTRSNPAPEGNTTTAKAPYGVFPSAGEDRWIAISVDGDAQWAGLTQVAHDQAWADDPRFATREGRLSLSQELNKLVGDWTRGNDGFDLMDELQAVGVAAGVVQNAQDLVERDPQLAFRGHFVTLDHPEMGPTVYNAAPYKFSRTPGGPRRSAPMLGQHNDEVFRGILGVSDEEMTRLQEDGTFK
jgi:benzylsuccinate CoA-transferase BbsF subunit